MSTDDQNYYVVESCFVTASTFPTSQHASHEYVLRIDAFPSEPEARAFLGMLSLKFRAHQARPTPLGWEFWSQGLPCASLELWPPGASGATDP